MLNSSVLPHQRQDSTISESSISVLTKRFPFNYGVIKLDKVSSGTKVMQEYVSKNQRFHV